MELTQLIWSPDGLSVNSGRHHTRLDLQVHSDDRYWLRLHAADHDQLYLLAAKGRTPFWLSNDRGLGFVPLDPVGTGDQPVREYQCQFHPGSNYMTVLEKDMLWIGKEAKNWTKIQLPEAFNTNGVSIDPNREIWLAGSVNSERIPDEDTEAAIRHKPSFSGPYQSKALRLGMGDTMKVIANGGLAELRAIDAAGIPVIASSLCSWFLEDNSSFVFILSAGKTFFKRLKGETIRAIDRSEPGKFRIFTAQGGIWAGNEKKLTRQSSVGQLEKALGISGRHILVGNLNAARIRLLSRFP